MTIRIVTDSTCDLPESVAQECGITVIPLYVNFGARSYLDGVELSRREFYEMLPQSDIFPTTAVPGLAVFTETYEQLASQGATEIISIHIAGSLSATCDVARKAAEETESIPVTVFDPDRSLWARALPSWLLSRTLPQAKRCQRSSRGWRTWLLESIPTQRWILSSS